MTEWSSFSVRSAYEAIGEFELAAADYEAAELLFPQEVWQARAWEGLSRTEREIHAHWHT